MTTRCVFKFSSSNHKQLEEMVATTGLGTPYHVISESLNDYFNLCLLYDGGGRIEVDPSTRGISLDPFVEILLGPVDLSPKTPAADTGEKIEMEIDFPDAAYRDLITLQERSHFKCPADVVSEALAIKDRLLHLYGHRVKLNAHEASGKVMPLTNYLAHPL